MKTAAITCLALLTIAARATAGFMVTKDVFRMSRLEAAKAEAMEKGKTITFLYSDENSTCPLCSESSSGIITGMRSKNVIVYVDTAKGDFAKLPPVVQQGLSSKEAGRFIPKTVITDAAVTRVLGIVPYTLGAEQAMAMKKARKQVSEAEKELAAVKPAAGAGTDKAGAGQPDAAARPAATAPEERTWTRKGAPALTAAFVEHAGGFVVLQRKDGTRVKVLASSLSAEDREYLATQAAK